ncbi:recombinase family protein [uncultured Vagococcus sp.]|uniref:recombinase family protein n=1 Tax=uncultured Vagococcus sp. TaxID=189676 RepID=UPI0028D677CB|nr:recombinase family protein [uncultured Vagococcus sp.]
MTVYGYARKDYPSQMATQIKLLLDYKCEKLFVEQYAFEEDKELQLLLTELEKDDIIVVESIVVFGKNLEGMGQILEIVSSKKAHLISINEKLDTGQTYSFVDNFNLVYHVNASYRSEHIKQRLAKSKHDGRQLGRPAINKKKIEEIRHLHDERKMSLRDIAVCCGVSLGTVHKYVHENS